MKRILIAFIGLGVWIVAGYAYAAPSVQEITMLDPTTTVYAPPFTDYATVLQQSVGSEIDSHDIIRVFPSANFTIGKLIKVWRAPRHKIIDGTKVINVASWGLTADEVIADAGVKLGDQDEITPTKNDATSSGFEISITRVAETNQAETEVIHYSVIEKNDPTLERGLTKVQQQGINGEREKVYLVRRENGEEVSRSLISDTVTQEVQNKIILVGTKIVVLSSETGEASWTYTKTASRRYPRGTLIRITNLTNGRSVETRVGDWGPMPYTGRIIDINIDTWLKISSGGAGSGTMQVKVEELNE